ncbi:MAG: PEP/pyruvate-binding domain-containing protein, partial [Chloroflexota bacterium]
LQYVRRCWQSLWSERATSYRQRAEAMARQRGDGPLPAPAMAVIVQALVPAEAAGVAFTADPLTGETATVTINAAWGFGESVVDGAVEADTWRIDRDSGEVVEQAVGEKSTRTGLDPDSPRETVPEDLRRQPSLTPQQVAAVARLALQAEAVIGAPADVEWAVAGDNVWLLQARPITGLPAARGDGSTATTPTDAAPAADGAASDGHVSGPTPDFPFEWPDAAAPALHWRRGNPDQANPIPARPLEMDEKDHFNRGRRHAASITGRDRAERLIWLNGYSYFATSDMAGPPEERERRRETFQRPADALHERGETYWQAVVFPEIDAGNQRLAAVDVDGIAPGELAVHLEDTLRWHERCWTLHWLWPGNGPQQRLAKLYKELTGLESDEQATEAIKPLLAYVPNKLSEAIDGLVALARTVQAEPALRDLFATSDAATAFRSLEGTGGGAAFRKQLDALLERQGLRCGAGFGTERNGVLPGWREDPVLVIALVQKYIPQDLDALEAGRRAGVERRDQLVADVRDRIADVEQRRQLDFWLEAARRQAQGFEDHNYYIDSASYALLHRAIMACARRLAASGALARAADVWWLRASQIAAALRGLP